VFGLVELEEIVLRTDEQHWLRPFAHGVGVHGRGKTERLQRVLTDFGIEESFAAGNRRLVEHYGFSLDASALRTATLTHARRAAEVVAAETAQPYRSLPAQGPATILAEADGSMVCTVPAATARAAARPRQWQDIRLVAAQAVGCTETTYGATFGNVQVVGQQWGHAAKQAGRALTSSIHVVCDGAAWLALQARAIFGEDATVLTDFFHVSEYLAAAAPSCRPANPAAWRHTQAQRLRRSASALVIAELAQHGEPPETPDEQAPVRVAHRYLQNRPETLDYASALAAELPIGSGLIESGHKHVLQRRLKLSGAAWLEENAEVIAQLRVFRANDRWNELWQLAA
jgi:hypothetical protein